MPTKYELQTELRELNRGFPRMPISKMKMHELEAAIDASRKMKGEMGAALTTKTPSVGGRPSARPILSESMEDEDVVLHVPKAPAPRISKPTPRIVKDDDDEPASLKAPKRVVKVEKVVEMPTKSERKTVHFCNCPNCKL
jgi:hypothetical protein